MEDVLQDSLALGEMLIKQVKNGKRHVNYDKTVKHAEQMEIHIEGKKPNELLTDYRPNEDKAIHDYRLRIWKPITKSCSKRAINVIQSISNPRYHTISFPEQPTVLGEDNLENFKYPYFESIPSWVFEVLIRQMLADPNGIVAFMPISTDTNGRYVPYGFFYESEDVIDYMPDEYYLVKTEEKSEVKQANKTVWSGEVYRLFTKTDVVRIYQYGEKSKQLFALEVEYTHNIGEPPVMTMGGEYVAGTFPFVYESYMSGVLPYWDDAVREYSDKQATFVQHVFLERVELQVQCDMQGCHMDNVKGKYVVGSGDDCRECTRCGGSGYITGRSPYGVTVVKDDKFDDRQKLFPGVQYVSKPTDIVNLLTEDIDKLISNGYEAIFMDFLIGANQSGVSKQYDRSELERYLMNISNNVFDNLIYYSYKYVAGWRYGSVFADGETWKEMLPDITKPSNFDVLSTEILAAQLKNAKEAGNSPTLVDQLERDYIKRMFAGNVKMQKKHLAFIKLDPLSNITDDNKFMRLANGGINEVDYIISSNIKKFVDTAISEDENFLDLNYTEQYAKMVEYGEAHRTNRELTRPDRPEDGAI